MSGPKVGVGVFVVSDNCVLVGKRCDLFLVLLSTEKPLILQHLYNTWNYLFNLEFRSK